MDNCPGESIGEPQPTRGHAAMMASAMLFANRQNHETNYNGQGNEQGERNKASRSRKRNASRPNEGPQEQVGGRRMMRRGDKFNNGNNPGAISTNQAASSRFGGGTDAGSRRSPSRRRRPCLRPSNTNVEMVTLSDTGTSDNSYDRGSSLNAVQETEFAIHYMAATVSSREGQRTMFKPTFTVCGGKYEVLERLGCGAYGNVYKVKDVDSNKLRALKVIRTDKMTDPDELHYVKREVDVLQLIYDSKPPEAVKRSIVKLLSSFTLSQHACIMYEFCGPTLHEILRNPLFRGYGMKDIRKISYQISVAVNFLHSVELIHHDIKPENVVFTSSNYEYGCGMEVNVKLIDFGSAIPANCRDGKTATTMRYRSPEIALKGKSSFASDVWSLGCTLFEIYTGRPLFNCKREEEKFYMIEAIFCDIIPPRLSANSGFDCFDSRGVLRYGEKASEIHRKVKPFNEFNDSPNSGETQAFFDLLSKMLAIRTCFRIDSYEVLRHPFFASNSCSYKYEPIVPATEKNFERYLRPNPPSRVSFKLKSNILI